MQPFYQPFNLVPNAHHVMHHLMPTICTWAAVKRCQIMEGLAHTGRLQALAEMFTGSAVPSTKMHRKVQEIAGLGSIFAGSAEARLSRKEKTRLSSAIIIFATIITLVLPLLPLTPLTPLMPLIPLKILSCLSSHHHHFSSPCLSRFSSLSCLSSQDPHHYFCHHHHSSSSCLLTPLIPLISRSSPPPPPSSFL